MMIFMLVQKFHLLYIHPQFEVEKTSSPESFFMVKLFLSYCSIKCFISKKKLNFIEFFFPIGILLQYRA